MIYDKKNIFARIIRKEIPCSVVCETDFSLALHDVHPQAPVHVLLIPKGEYINMGHFLNQANTQEISDFFDVLARLPRLLNVQDTGYRLIANAGPDARQEVPHFHMHLLAGAKLPLFKNGQIVQD